MYFQDLQMWSQTVAREPYLSAYAKAKRLLESGFEPNINWVEEEIVVTQGKYLGNRTKIKDKIKW